MTCGSLTFDPNLFKELDISKASKVKIANGDYIVVKEKGTMSNEGSSSEKLIRDVLFVPYIS